RCHAPRGRRSATSRALFRNPVFLELEGVRRVVDSHDESPGLTGSSVRQLEGEWRVAALMLAQPLAIEPRGRLPVERAEREKHATSVPTVGGRNSAGIPPDVGAVRDTRQRRAPGKRHHDLAPRWKPAAWPALAFPAVLRIEGEPPAAVEVEPLRACEVGTRMLRKGNAVGCGTRDGDEERQDETHLIARGVSTARPRSGTPARSVPCRSATDSGNCWTSSRRRR